MSNARELALIEKWADVAATTIPPISPTSPKATKFCCCPNRRRYNLHNSHKQLKKSTLHARNIFVDNDFTYIDDVAQEKHQHRNNKTNSNSSDYGSINCNSKYRATNPETHTNDKGVVVSIGNHIAKDETNSNKLLNLMNNSYSYQCFPAVLRHDNKCLQQQQQQECENHCSCEDNGEEKEEDNNQSNNNSLAANKNCAAVTSDNDNDSIATAGPTVGNEGNEPARDEVDNIHSNRNSDQQFQRLSNNKLNLNSNKENSISGSNCNSSYYSAARSWLDDTDNRINKQQQQQQQQQQQHQRDSNKTNSKIDLQNKMTITTTTNVANRKRSMECGPNNISDNSMEAATSSPATTVATRPSRPTTPSLTTVIKTTMVKRSPTSANETTSTPTSSAATTPTSPTSPTALVVIASSTPCSNYDERGEPRRSVKERIAAYAAGNEQTNNHDSSFKFHNKTKIPSNGLKSNQSNSNMTSHTINQQPTTTTHQQHNHNATVVADISAGEDIQQSDSNNSKPLTLNKSNKSSSISPPRGSATMPRRRISSSLATATANDLNSHKATAMTLDKQFSGMHIDKNVANAAAAKLQLDNLDLALNWDLTDEDGEDPYGVLQDYLERVKHEINEVFELHKARQRMQQIEQEPHNEQQQKQPSDKCLLIPTSQAETNTKPKISVYDQLDSLGSRPKEHFTIKLTALAPPPLSPSDNSNIGESPSLQATPMPSINGKVSSQDDVNIWANKCLKDLDNLMALPSENGRYSHNSALAATSPTTTTSPMLLSAAATAAIQNRYGKNGIAPPASPGFMYSETQNSNGMVLRPEKHATIPLQSFNLDCKRNQNNQAAASKQKTNVAYLRTLSAPTPYAMQQLTQNENKLRSAAAHSMPTAEEATQNYKHLTNFQSNAEATAATTTNVPTTCAPSQGNTILKIEETAAAAAVASAQKRSNTLAADAHFMGNSLSSNSSYIENMRHALLTQKQQQQQQLQALESGSNMSLTTAASLATSIPKRERINHAKTTAATTSPHNSLSPTPSTAASSNLLTPPSKATIVNWNDATKKGSTSTIWTSEESILRSVGAVDEDNNSTSSSACEETTGAMSSGKSGISLDSSGLDNENNESGIGTATPPKDMSYWKRIPQNDNESVSSLEALRKMKFQKSSSQASSDDPDLLEVLSLCDEPQHDDDDDDVDEEEEEDEDGGTQQDKADNVHNKNKPKCQRRHRQCKRQATITHDSEQHDDSNDAIEVEDEADELHHTVGDDHEVEDDVDEGHDEFETIPYCECDYTDGDASSGASGISSSHSSSTNNTTNNELQAGVVLRRKYVATPILVPWDKIPKNRSHSLDTCSLPVSYQHYQHHQQQQQQQQHHHPHHAHHPHHFPFPRKLHHLRGHGNNKERGQLSLALRQEPFQSLLSPTHFNELPSPSSASLHSGHESLGIQELTTKSNSAPLLLKQEKKRDDFTAQNLTLRYSRSQSDRYLAEIEAVEACKWLRAAGFPQYAQMYEDHQFPLDLTNVAKDHTNLENDQLQSLYRRLCILNRCANMRVDQSHKTQTPQKEDSDDENFALSENWTFQPHIRRWSRIGEMGLELPPAGKLNLDKTESSSKESSPDRFEDDNYDITGASLNLTVPGAEGNANLIADSTDPAVRLRRTGSERLKDGAKALLRRVESIKSRRRKRQNREGIVISGPQTLDLSHFNQRSSLRKPDAVYSTPPSPSAVSPMHTFPKSPFFGNELKVPSCSENFLSPNRSSPKRTPTTPRSMRTSPLHFFSTPMPHLKEGKSDDSSSYYSDSQESSTGGKLNIRKTPSKTRRFLQQRTGKVDDIGMHSDSECHQGRKLLIKDANSNTTEVKVKKLIRGGSLNLGKDPKKRDGFRSASFRSRSTTRKEKTDETDVIKKTPVRWHSFQMEERPLMIFRKCFSQKIEHQNQGIPFATMSVGQLQIIRKLALVILTGHMEHYCPTHRSGWNWELPKFIKKIKMPDYKDKKVFGVPLILIMQRSGQTLPIAVRAAFRWLQLNALDQIGLFRKSGVKSRITKLKEMIEYSETTAECMDVFDTQQAYDVADMLKQYFRDLPESLLTTKMSETFAAIFMHLPAEVRLDAVQCAVLLLPDENREILYALLEFLTLVADNSQFNQMTANNLAVCLAPSLFHNNISTAASVNASPRRRKGAGVPDAKELSEAKAAHECLAFMIEHYKKIYTVSKDKLLRCNFGTMEESRPVPLEALGEDMPYRTWRGYLVECISATMKEGREKTRGWIAITSQTDPYVDIAYKKVGDGHVLRLWRCITEVEGPPKDVMDYVIKQRASWDVNLLQAQTVKQLDDHIEVFQYALDGQLTTDFCVVRSWQTDLPRGACVIVETSIDYPKAKPMFGAVRGVVLASRYLIEPCGSGRSRVMHLARVDIKGKTPEWYNKSYGHICSHYLSKIRLAFKNVADGPESKV